MRNVIKALKNVSFVLFLLLSVGVAIVIGVVGLLFLTQVGVTTGLDSVVNLVIGVALFMVSLGIVIFVLFQENRSD